MEKTTLKLVRLIAPGILIYLVLLPLKQGGLSVDDLVKIDTQNALYLLVVLVLGGLYKTLQLRDQVFREPIKEIQDNIRDSLLSHFLDSPRIQECRKVDIKKFMSVFYYFVDKDETLTQKSKDIYENGALLSTYADVIVVSTWGLVAYVIALVITHSLDYLIVCVVLLLLIVLSYVLLGIAKRTHKRIGDEQLYHLGLIYKTELQEKLEALATHERIGN